MPQLDYSKMGGFFTGGFAALLGPLPKVTVIGKGLPNKTAK